jgi:hypothetical protein
MTLWLFLKAFAAGCTAMTGVEAVSNGVQAFKEPVVKTARRSLTLIVVLLAILLLGIAYLVPAFHITATEPGSSSYQSILSLLVQAIVGRGVFYYVTIVAILLVLCLSANTSFAQRGRRLVYTEGILVLMVLSAGLLILFNGVTDRLIPLFAIGAFLAFTLSQSGMIVHWLRSKEPRARINAFINGTGAVATGVTFAIVIVTKFAEGAWLVMIVLPALYGLMFAIRRHYSRIEREIAASGPVRFERPKGIIAVLPVQSLNALSGRALQIAYQVAQQVFVLHITEEDAGTDFLNDWNRAVESSIEQTGLPPPEMVILKSPYRKVLDPILDYIWNLENEHPDKTIAVLIPQLIESRWYYRFMHNQRASILRTILLLKGRNRILIVNVPWNLECKD